MHADDFGKMLKKDNPDKLNPRMNQRRMIGQRVTFDRYDTAYTGCKII